MADLYRFAWPVLRRMPPEGAGRFALWALRRGLVPPPSGGEYSSLHTEVWGLAFSNPLGLAAGCDKDAVAVDGFFALGFGFVEVGTVTPKPQAGNPRPRLFRLEEDGALINRLGFNSAGADVVRARLARRAGGQGIVGVNVGPNRDSDDVVGDLRALVQGLKGVGDYVAINVSSPNTPGLRDMQAPERLSRLVNALREGDSPRRHSRPILLKISPDLSEAEREGLAELALAKEIDGLIVANTTTARPTLWGLRAAEAGGLSGRPLFAPSTAILADMYRLTRGRIPLVGVGGVFSGADAYAKIQAGASLVQLYTGLVYRGPRLVAEISADLDARLAADGFKQVGEAVGTA